MPEHPQLRELGEFLRARREQLTPTEAGLSVDDGPRRVPGLRREEAARLATISVDYYIRLEQGRIHPSEAVLHELATALQLTEDQTAYLYALGGKILPRPDEPALQVTPHLQRLLDDLTHVPAFVIGRRTQVLAWNPIGAALLTDFAAIPPQRRQFLRVLFTDPAMRKLYADWEQIGRLTIAQLRMDAVRYPDDPELDALVAEIAARDADFRRWWEERDAALREAGTKTLHHPIVGTLHLDWSILVSAGTPDQELLIWTAAPGTDSERALHRLAAHAQQMQRSAPGGAGSGE